MGSNGMLDQSAEEWPCRWRQLFALAIQFAPTRVQDVSNPS
jgi:hypothetical protein